MLLAAQQLQHLHLFVDLQKNLRSQVLAKLLNWRWHIPYCSYDKERLHRLWLLLAARTRGRRQSAPAYIHTPRHPQHERIRTALARALRTTANSARPRLVVTAAVRRRGNLGIAVGASYATKRAPLSLFKAILQHVVQQHDNSVPLSIYVLGNEHERQLGEHLCRELATTRVTRQNLCGQLPLTSVAQQLANMAVLLCNDSGLLHVAEAVGTPVVALFGPTVEAFGFSPWQARSRVFSSSIGCRPCSRHGATPCRYGDKKCFTLLDPAAIATALLQRLG